MNYILVSSSSSAGQRGFHCPQRVNFSGPTYIDYYAERITATLLQAQLNRVFMVSPQITLMYPMAMPTYANFPPQGGFSYNYRVNMPALAVLEFLKQHGYLVVGTNTIGDTCIWTLHKQTGTTDQSTPQTAKQSTPQTTAQQSTPHQTTEQMMQRMQPLL